MGGIDDNKIRAAAVAGSFYPGDPRRLEAEVVRLLAQVPASAGAAPKALVAPHAGYVYSGAVAASAFAQLRDRPDAIAWVVVIGPAHYVPLRGIAVPTAEVFATPLGRVAVDRDALAALTDLPFVSAMDSVHAPEHAIEVELPFLQKVLPRFALVPLLVGSATAEEAAEVVRRLWGGAETLIVVSSDLSHYHDYETARRRDAATALRIEQGDWAALGPGDACGHLPIAGLLVEAARRGLAARRLALCNSGDTAGPRHEVVGYGAWAFSGSKH
ncbi:MAG TPA: AmmeMemoRadiSam system protein B [Xanthobacteraceae bacterium]|nr:AmmeMemoRadiSam system protein B [Xanthobacteraceae bacterium]